MRLGRHERASTAESRFVCITAPKTRGRRVCQGPATQALARCSRAFTQRERAGAPQFKHRRGFRARCDARLRRAPRHARAASPGTMPWPRLNTCPGAGPAARTMRCALRAPPSTASVSSTSGIEVALQRDATRRLRARAAAMSTVQSRPTHCGTDRGDVAQPTAAAAREHDRRRLVAFSASTIAAHRRRAKTCGTRRREKPAPRVEDHHGVGAAVDLRVEVLR